MISQGAFFKFFWHFHFLGCRRSKGRNFPKMKNNNDIHLATHLWNSIADDHNFLYSCVKWWDLHGFFLFWNLQNNSEWFCLLNFISQEPPYQECIWSWLMVHICKRIISPGVFLHFFKILILRVNSGPKEQEMAWNDKKLCLC